MYILLCIKQVTNEHLHRELYPMLCGDLNGKEIFKRGDTCISRADSLCCTAEANNIVKQLYSNNFFFLEKIILLYKRNRTGAK